MGWDFEQELASKIMMIREKSSALLSIVLIFTSTFLVVKTRDFGYQLFCLIKV
jgi:hypothetical protein